MQGLLIPTDVGVNVETIEVSGTWQSMRDAIGGRCIGIERVRTRLTQPHLGNLVLVVDEEGLYHDWPDNVRAKALYAPEVPHARIKGPALLFREGMSPDGGMDFMSVQPEDHGVVMGYLLRTVG